MPDILIKTIQPYLIGGVFVMLYLAEHLFPQEVPLAPRKHDINNLLIGMVNAGITFLAGYYFQQVIQWLNLRHIGLFNLFALPFPLMLLFQILCLDLFMYGWHRINHVIPWLWSFHRFHHLDQRMNLTTALRFHVVELLLSYAFRLMVFPLLGFSLTAIVLYSLLFFPVVMLHHSNIAIREKVDLFIRHVIVTPRMHRIHHSQKKLETNSNYSSVFPWWDRIFHTYRNQPVAPIQFGVE